MWEFSAYFLYRRRACGDLRSVPEADRSREQVQKHGRACTQVLFLCKAELGLFHFLEIMTGWLVPSAGQKITIEPGRSRSLKTGFFRQVRELEIQKKNPSSALLKSIILSYIDNHQIKQHQYHFLIVKQPTFVINPNMRLVSSISRILSEYLEGTFSSGRICTMQIVGACCKI
jgi:hypothetical protein